MEHDASVSACGALTLQQRRRLREAVHQVEVLHRGAGGALDQVVQAADREHAAADDAGRDVAEVRAAGVLGAGQVVDDADERLVGVELAQALEQPGSRSRCPSGRE